MNLLTLSLSSPSHLYASSTGGSSSSSGTFINLPRLPNFLYPPFISLPESAPPPPPPHRPRRNPTETPPPGKSATIPAPYPWAEDRRCTLRTLTYLLSHNIFFITGEVQCKKCDRQYTMEYNLEQKFKEIATFIGENMENMNDRAPKIWMSPALPNCRLCKESNCVKPVMSVKKKSINWLFLFLGQMVGCCTLDQLKYFCKHTRMHRTGAKNRLVFYTYMGLCNQLQPEGPGPLI